MILEEVMNYSNNTINISESVISLDDYLDLVCEQCNYILLESYKEDMKITKEDLLDPNKLKGILKRLEREKIEPSKKEKIAFGIVIGIVAILAVATEVLTISSILLFENIIGAILIYIVGLVTTLTVEIKLLNRFTTLNNFRRVLKKVEDSKNKLTSEINKKDGKDKKKLQEQLKLLNKVEVKIKDTQIRVLETWNGQLKKNPQGAHNTLNGYLKTKDSKKSYIKRLKEFIKDEKDPKIKKSMQDHLKRVEEFRTEEEIEKEWWR